MFDIGGGLSENFRKGLLNIVVGRGCSCGGLFRQLLISEPVNLDYGRLVKLHSDSQVSMVFDMLSLEYCLGMPALPTAIGFWKA